MSQPALKPTSSQKLTYAPFRPHPEIEKDSNLAKVVSIVDARADKDRNGTADPSESESESSDDDTKPSIESADGVTVESDELAAQGEDVLKPLAKDATKAKATSQFPLPPLSPSAASLEQDMHSLKQSRGGRSDRGSSEQDSAASAGATRSPGPDRPVSRIVGRPVKPPLGNAIKLSSALKAEQPGLGACAPDQSQVIKSKSMYSMQEHPTFRGQLRSNSEHQIAARSGSQHDLPNDIYSGSIDQASERSGPRRSQQAGRFSNSSDWVPVALPNSKSFIHNLPTWDGRSTSNVPRSTQNHHINRDIDFTMRKLMSEDLFERLLDDTLGKHRFRDFLSRTHCTSVAKLDMLTDIVTYTKTVRQLKDSCEALHDLYLAQDSSQFVQNLPDLVATEITESLRAAFHLPISTESVQSHLLKSLYQNEFQRFIKKQMVEETKVRLGKLDLGDDRSGLGDCFCLTNPRLKENPIVLISDGFEALTGYPAQAVIGYNCRFLQSSGTSADSIQRVRDALNHGEGICEILLNYRKDGTPFWNLLNIIPLRDTEGRLAYFLAGQIEITGALAGSKGLGFLLGGAGSVDDMSGVRDQVSINGNNFSPSMSQYLRSKTLLNEDMIERRDSEAGEHSRRTSIKSEVALNRSRIGGLNRNRAYQESESIDQKQDRRMYSASTAGSELTGKVGSSIMGRMTSKFRTRNAGATAITQQIGGAETTLRRGTFNLDEQMAYFSDVYSKVIVFKRHKREVIFVTPELLRFLGYRTATNKETFSSSLIHSDLLSLICGSDNVETKAIRASVKDAVKAGKEFSIMTCVKLRSSRSGSGFSNAAARLFGGTNDAAGVDAIGQDLLSSGHSDQDRRYVTIHLTPLRDSKKASFAFVGVIA